MAVLKAGDHAGVDTNRPHRPHRTDARGDGIDYAVLLRRRVLPHVMTMTLGLELRHDGVRGTVGKNENVRLGHGGTARGRGGGESGNYRPPGRCCAPPRDGRCAQGGSAGPECATCATCATRAG